MTAKALNAPTIENVTRKNWEKVLTRPEDTPVTTLLNYGICPASVLTVEAVTLLNLYTQTVGDNTIPLKDYLTMPANLADAFRIIGDERAKIEKRIRETRETNESIR